MSTLTISPEVAQGQFPDAKTGDTYQLEATVTVEANDETGMRCAVDEESLAMEPMVAEEVEPEEQPAEVAAVLGKKKAPSKAPPAIAEEE